MPTLPQRTYDAILSAQGGGCAMCDRQPEGRRLDVDHDHATGLVRGLLCRRCNRQLGRLQARTPRRLAATSPYLSNPPAQAIAPGLMFPRHSR